MHRSKGFYSTTFVGAGEQSGGNGKPKRLCGVEVDAELETGLRLDRYLRWPFAFQDAVDIMGGAVSALHPFRSGDHSGKMRLELRGADMARPSKASGRTSKTTVLSASQAKQHRTDTSPNGKRRTGHDTELARLKRELNEALQQQAATADILKVIASSSDDVQPVFDAIVNSAALLFAPCTATITTLSDGKLHWIALATLRSEFDISGAKAVYPLPFDPHRSLSARAILERRIIEIYDTDAPDTPEYTRRASAAGGFRSATFVPLVHRERGIGTIILTHPQTGFRLTADQLALVQTFADQAVIAIENARLFSETREALEHQTATAEVLRVISSSMADPKPVFEHIVDSIERLFKCKQIGIFLTPGDGLLHLAAGRGTNMQFVTSVYPQPIDQTAAPVVLGDHQQVYYPDVLNGPDVPRSLRRAAQVIGNFSDLLTPMMWEGRGVGMMTITREPNAIFRDKERNLLKTYADQAVIAIENTRLFSDLQAKTRELQEALVHQTGSANILKVIASSPVDVKPVLEAIVESACELCEADDAVVHLRDGDELRFGAHHGTLPVGFETHAVGREFVAGRSVVDKVPIHLHDAMSAEGDDFTETRRMSLQLGLRTILGAPMLREAESIGTIVLRRIEVRPFSEKQIALLQTFADQAVIAIENTRLFDQVQAKSRDLEEALRYQTGSSNILGVIASSPTDVAPVLKAIVETACRLCEAYDAVVVLKDGRDLLLSAHHGPIPMNRERWSNDRTSVSGRSIADRSPVHLHDVLSDEGAEFLTAREMSLDDGCRTILGAPMLSEGEAIGAIALRRAEVQPFSDKQISLLQTFANQAVIAIGNVHLFDEVQSKTRDLSEALTYQTGSSNILRVIASSPTDVGPVLKAIVESACDLCEAYDAVVLLRDGDDLRFSAHHGPIPMSIQKWPINRRWTAGRAFVDQKPVHVHDLLAEGAEFPDGRELSRRMGHRTIVSVPLLREDESIGSIVLRRTEVHPFSEKQIALLQTFADQAVIAIGNVRMFEEVRAKTRDLTEMLQQQTATSEVLKVISGSPSELDPVFGAILENAVRICEAKFGNLFLAEGEKCRWVAGEGTPPKLAEFFTRSTSFVPTPGSHLARVMRTRQVSYTADDAAEAVVGAAARLGGLDRPFAFPWSKMKP